MAPPSLMAATLHGRQQRDKSLANLEHDKAGLLRSPLSKKFPVKMVFLLAPYRTVIFDKFVIKRYQKIEPVGSTSEVMLVLSDRHDNERGLLQWLFDSCRVSKEHTGGKGPNVDDWRLCTTACRGTANKGGSWEMPAWDPANPVTLGDYKSQVHETDGKEKDPSRTGFIPGKTARNSRRILAVFAVCEILLEDRNEAQEEGFADVQTHVTPPVASWEDDEELFCRQPSSPPSPTPIARPLAPPQQFPSAFERSSLRSADTQSVPSRLNFSALAAGSTDQGRPSTAASSVVEMSSNALSEVALARFTGHQHWLNGPATPSQRGTDVRGAAEGIGSDTVRLADLTLARPAATIDAIASGPGFVDADNDVEEAHDVVGRKRKVLRPDQSEADGSVRTPSRPKRARKQTAKAQAAPENRRARRGGA